MKSAASRLSLVVLFTVSLLMWAGPATADEEGIAGAPTPTVPTRERCRLFCAGVFERTSKEYSECCDGCDDAEACNAVCREKFPGDGGRHSSCFKACMAKGRGFERPPTPALPQL